MYRSSAGYGACSYSSAWAAGKKKGFKPGSEGVAFGSPQSLALFFQKPFLRQEAREASSRSEEGGPAERAVATGARREKQRWAAVATKEGQRLGDSEEAITHQRTKLVAHHKGLRLRTAGNAGRSTAHIPSKLEMQIWGAGEGSEATSEGVGIGSEGGTFERESVGGKCGDPAARNGPAKIAKKTWYYWVDPRPRSRTLRQSLMSIAEFPQNQVVSGSAAQNVSIIDLLNKIQPMCWNL